MTPDRNTIEALLAAGKNDEVIALLIDESPPAGAWQLAMLARAYLQRGDSRGDLYSAAFFARRAVAAGFEEPWIHDILDRYQAIRPEAEVRMTPPRRPDVDAERDGKASPYSFNALSVQRGTSDSPKDFDWATRNVPCQAACPAQTDIPEYLTAISEGDYAGAYRINLESNVFPGVLGRVCARPCEPECRHGWDGLGDSVAICFSKRAAADLRDTDPVLLDPWFAPSGKTVAVVGAGVAGLTAARELARLGHTVTVYEKHHEPGGMMNQGIPEFRLPREVIDHEIEQIRLLGVTIQCGTDVGRDIGLEALVDKHDAVVMAAGTLRPNLLELPGKELAGVRHGLDFLLEANTTGTATVGRHVVVIGGGFTAMDCARTAKRLGAATLPFPDLDAPGEEESLLRAPADHVAVWYRRTETEMLVTPGEVEELGHEGIRMEFLVSPVRFIGENGRVAAIEFIRNKLGAPDDGGRRRPVPIPGSEFQRPADTVLLATGQYPDLSWISGAFRPNLVGEDGWLQSGQAPETAIPGLFTAGDFAQGASSLISAIGHAKNTAYAVDAFLTGRRRVADKIVVEEAVATGRIREMDAVPLQPMPTLPVARRTVRKEVEQGYSGDIPQEETQRCYRCHFKYEIDSDECIYCDWCIKVKPRPECILRVRKLLHDAEGRITGWEEADGSDETYLVWINQEDCIRCGACMDACPVDAISLQKARRETGPAQKGKA